ncbi:MAG: YraN family protein [Thermoguttaceae bacterium]|nr:YraN family protein [Thermoguttaceae bacterium]
MTSRRSARPERLASRIARALADLWNRAFGPATLGARGERAAAGYLKRQGCKIVARGDRGDLGEIDLVALDRHTIVFVEVKTRQSQQSGHPSEAVDAAKQRRLTRLALAWLKRRGLLDCPARFDVIAVTWPPGRGRPSIDHCKNAFEAVGNRGMFS